MEQTEKMTYEEYKIKRNLYAAGSALGCFMYASLSDAAGIGAVVAAFVYLFVRFTDWRSECDFVGADENGIS